MLLGMILLLALLVRLGWALSRPTSDAALNQLPDQHDYLSLARSILHGDGFVFRDPRFPDELKAFRTPGYPVFLALFGANARAIRVAQVVIDASTVLAIYAITRRLTTDGRKQHSPSPGTPREDWGGGRTASVHSQGAPSLTLLRSTGRGKSSFTASSESIALAAAFIVAVNPFLVYFSGLLLTETLFSAMLAWAMLLLVCASRSGKWTKIQWLAAALLLTTSILVRPSGIALPMMLGVAAVCVTATMRERAVRDMGFQPMPNNIQTRENRKVSQHGLEAHVTAALLATSLAKNPADPNSYQPSRLVRRAGIAATAMLLLTLLTLLPWAVRNHGVLGRWIPLDTNSGFTLYDGFNPSATGASDQSFVKRIPALQGMNELQRSDYLGRQAREYVLENPGRVVSLAVAKVARTWSPITLSSEFGQPRYQIVAAAFAIPFDLLVIVGLFSPELSRGTKAFLLTPALYFSIVHALTVGSLRYRIPAEPPLAIPAAAALVGAASKMRRRSTLIIQTPEAPQ